MADTPVISPNDLSDGSAVPQLPTVNAFQMPSEQTPLETFGKMKVSDFLGTIPTKQESNEMQGIPTYTAEPLTERYPIFNPYVDNEEAYAKQQGFLGGAWNALVKMGGTATSAFASGLMSIPDTIREIGGGNPYKNEFSQAVDDWSANLENKFPNYYSNWEREHPFLSALPFSGGATNFWFDGVMKNIGYTIGAIGSAVVQDAVVGAATQGIGEIPLIANQVGKASLWLNKLFSGTNRLEEVLATANQLGKSEQTILSLKKMAALAEAQKIGTGARYLTSLYGSAHAEAAIEARQGYSSLKNELIDEFTSANGYEPTAEDMAKIETTATDAGNYRYGINLALLAVSNAVQFDNILKPFQSLKNNLRTGIGATTENQTGKIGLASGNVSSAADIDNLVIKGGSGKLAKVGSFFQRAVPNIFTEGVIEEGSQFSAEVGINQYFKDRYDGKIAGDLNDAINSTIDALGKQYGTSEGLQNMLIGGITGGILGPVSRRISDAKSRAAGMYSGKEATQQALNSLNSVGVMGLFQQNYDSTADMMKINSDIAKAVAEDNMFKFKNLKADAFYNFVTSGINASRFDVRIEQLKMLNELPNEEINKLFGIDESAGVDSKGYINTLINKANEIKRSHDAISNIFQNPYSFKGNAKTEEDIRSNEAYLAFEDYKNAITKFSYNVNDFKSRKVEIQGAITQTSPSISNNLVQALTNPIDLKNLSIEYKEQVAEIQKAIDAKALTGKDRINALEQIKFLETYSRKIDNTIRSNSFDKEEYTKLFTDILNFEVAGRNTNVDPTITRESSIELIKFGNDLNQIDKGIKYAENAYDYLFTQEGFDDFMKNHKEWKDSLSLNVIPEEERSELDQFIDRIIAGEKMDSPEDIQYYENNKDVIEAILKRRKEEDELSKSFIADREYAYVGDAKYKVTKTKDNFRVKNPKGDIVDTFSTKEEAVELAKYYNENLTKNLSKIKVIGYNDNGTISVEDSEGNVQSLPASMISDYSLIKTDEEIARENQALNDLIDKKQSEFIPETRPDVPTPPIDNTSEYDDYDGDLKKPIDKLFASSTYNHKTSGNKEFIKSQQEFLTNVSNFDNRDSIRAIIITPNNEAAFNLTGLSAMLLEGSGISAEDPATAPISQVFVEVDGNAQYFVNKNGERIGRVGVDTPVLSDVIVATLPTTSLQWVNGDVRYSRATPEEAAAWAKEWDKKRNQLLAMTGSTEMYDFNISRGVPERNEPTADGTAYQNAVGGTLIPRNKIGKKGIIKVVTKESIDHNGEQIRMPIGAIVFQNGPTLEMLNARNLTEKEALNIYNVMLSFVRDAVDGGMFNRQILNYLQGKIYWGMPQGNKQIFFSKSAASFFFGENLSVPLTTKAFEANKKAIVDFLQNTYFNVNNKYLRENHPYEEIIGVRDDGRLETILWKSYQHFLISDKYDLADDSELSGKPRSINDIPVTTNIKVAKEGEPNFIHRYSTLTQNSEGKSFIYVDTPAKKTAKATSKVEQTTAEGNDWKYRELPGGSIIVYKSKNGDISDIKIVHEDGREELPPNPEKTRNFLLKKEREERGEKEPEQPEFKYNLDGESINSFTTSTGMEIDFSAVNDNGEIKVSIYDTKDYNKALATLMSKRKDMIKAAMDAGSESEEVAAKDILVKIIANDIKATNKLESTPIETKTEDAVKEEVRKEEQQDKPQNKPKRSSRRGNYRITDTASKAYEIADLDKEEKWFTERFDVPFIRVKNLIETTGGGYAFGEFRNAAVYLYENAEVGTTYHEAFETVWGMFTDLEERKRLVREFNNREGSYIDRENGEEIPYAMASEHQAKEQMAEEFRDYVLNGTLTYKPKATGNIIYRFFKQLLQFIRSFFTNGVQNEQELFDRIQSGYYKGVAAKNVYYDPSGTYSEVRIPGLSVTDSYKVVQGVTIEVFQKLFGEGSDRITSLDEGKIPPSKIYQEVYDELYEIYNGDYEDSVSNLKNKALVEKYKMIWEAIEKNWPTVVKLTNSYLETYGIIVKNKPTQKLVEDGEVNEKKDAEDVGYEVTDRSESYLVDQFKFDFAKNAPASVKILFSTLTKAQFDAIDATIAAKTVSSVIDPATYMQQALEFSSSFNYIMDKLYSANSIEEKQALLKQVQDSNPDYVRLFNRLKFNEDKGNASLEDWILRARFFNVFSKQRPTGLIQYASRQGVYTESANTNVAVAQKIQSWLDSLKVSEGGLVKSKEDYYIVDKSVLDSYNTSTVDNQIAFLNAMEIDFTKDMYNNMSKSNKAKFSSITSSLYETIRKTPKISSLTPKGLRSTGNLNELGKLYVQSSGQGVDSTYYNIERERVGQYLQPNTISFITNDINNVKTAQELQERHPQFRDIYRADSVYLNPDGVLFDESGDRNETRLEVKYIQGTILMGTDNQVITNSNLNESQRMIQEINQNLNEDYYILVPADSKTEWMISLKNNFPISDFSTDSVWNRVANRFEKYYNTERQIAGEDQKYTAILYPKFAGKNGNFNKEAFIEYIKTKARDNIRFLKYSGIILRSRGTANMYEIPLLDTDFAKNNNLGKMTEEELETLFFFREVNYAQNVIELHKLFFGDISKIKDPTKRYKSFLSPRETSIVSDEFDNVLNTLNKAGDIELTENDPGYWNAKSYMDTITIRDVITETPSIVNDNNLPKFIKDAYKKNNVADAQSWAPLASYREINQKRGYNWTNGQQKQFEYLMALDRFLMNKDTKAGILPESIGYRYTSAALENYDKELISKGNPHTGIFNPLKPIGTGSTEAGNTFLDKTSVAPMFYSLYREVEDGQVKLKTMAYHYAKMIKGANKISYAIVESGRKIGAGTLNSLYNEDGTPNVEPYKDVISIPFKYYGIQTETGGQHDKNTLGSQLTKLATQNLMDAGVPKDFMADDNNWNNRLAKWNNLLENEKRNVSRIYNYIRHNTETLEELQRIGYQDLLNKLDIIDTGYEYVIQDKTKVEKLLKEELLRRESPENKKSSITLNKETGEFEAPFEATAAYDEIKSILYSYVDKLIAKPKVNGGQRIQISAAGFEFAGKKVTTGKDSKGRDIFISEGLKFYEATYDEQGNRISVARMEVMLPNWFAKKLRKLGINKSDSELIKFLNETEEGKKVLNGVGFRIPTQDTNSIEAFTVTAFLPESLGDSVVVPEAITTKAGSDFDVDKLNMYLKNIYVTVNNKEIRTVPFFGFGESARKRLEELAVLDVLTSKSEGSQDSIDNLTYEDFEAEDITDDVNNLYRQSIENEYFKSLEDLILLPENYERLVTPNSTDEILDVRDTLVNLSPTEFGTSLDNSVINSGFMSRLRHLFLIGKSGVGVAAVAQTNNALNQLSQIYIDPVKWTNLPKYQSYYFGDGKIMLPHNTIELNGRKYATLSKITDKDNRYISEKISQYLNGFVDIAKDPFISQIIQSPSLIGTFLFLEKVGVPSKTVALFMNQPIIREYIKMLGRENTTWLYNENFINKKLFPIFAATSKTSFSSELDNKTLGENINKFYEQKKKFTAEENAQQKYILGEFLKYSVMAANLFELQRGTTYDTDSSSDPNLRARKEYITSKAINNNVISSINDIFNSSFLGGTKDLTGRAIDAISQSLFVTTKGQSRVIIRDIIDQVLDMRGIDAKSYKTITRNIEQSFIDYVIQTNTKLNNRIKELIIDTETAVALQLRKLKRELPKGSDLYNNTVLRKLIPIVRANNKGPKNIGMIFRANDAFTSDIYTAAFRELRDNPHTQALYGNLIRIALLQSGIATTATSYSKYLPFEDYQKGLSPVLQKLDSLDNLQQFADNGMFFKNNWSNASLVPSMTEGFDYTGFSKNKFGTKWYQSLKDKYDVKSYYNTPYKVDSRKKEASAPYITLNVYADSESALMDQGAVKILLKRLEDENGDPVMQQYPGSTSGFYIYYPVNALGNGYNGKEYYDDLRPSVYPNGYLKLAREFSNQEVLDAYRGEDSNTTVETDTTTPPPIDTTSISPSRFEPLNTWKKSGKKEKFNINHSTQGKVEVEGYRITFDGHPNLNTFIFKNNDGYWTLIDEKSGYSLGSGLTKTIKEAIEYSKEMVNKAIANPKQNAELLINLGITSKNEQQISPEEGTEGTC